MPGEAIWFLVLGGMLSLLGALGGIMAERRRLGFVIRDQAARNAEQSRRITELDRIIVDLKGDNSALSSFLVVLPDVVRRLNSNMSRRGIPPLLTGMLEQIFEPSRILIYTSNTPEELVLAHGTGLGDGLERGQRIRVGEGKIGAAARNQVAMDRDDIHSESQFRRASTEAQDRENLGIDLIAPMVHEGRTLGVICVGGLSKRHRDEKKMVKLVADLGSLALNNVELFSKLENMANKDSLTNLCTKRFLSLKLGELTHRAEQSHTPLSVIIFDIDHFKRFNDTYGHLAGDEILKTVAGIIRGQLRSDDIPARYGGEEFVVVLPNTVKEDAVRIADKIRRSIEQHPFPGMHGSVGLPGRVTASGGVASLLVDGKSSQEMLGAADQALYLAKEQGRNRIVAFRTRYLSDDEGELAATV